ncbi:MAG: TRAP transporter large permease [Treponema sp.]|jgi:C4-dicarboxylate transporter DctM subunit|nr:TRAP transporter large permease [Treponema sp.]
MNSTIVILLFTVFYLALGVPVGVSFILSMASTMLLYPVTNITFIAQNMYTALDSLTLIAIPCFILAGVVMETGGLSRRLIRIANCMVGRFTGGLGLVVVLACLFFGAVSGSAPATVAAIGGIMIPAMVKQGYEKTYSTALVAAAGGLGVIVPPSIPFVIYGCTVGVSIGSLFMAGFIPALVIAVFLMAVHLFIARKEGYTGSSERISFKEFLKVLLDGIWALLMPVIILGGIYGGVFTPTEASVVAVVYGVIVGMFVYKELTLKDLFRVLDENVSFIGAIMFTLAPATILGALFALMGVPEQVSVFLGGISQNKYIILLIINVVLLFVGMIMDSISAIVILAPTLMGALLPFGVDPVHFGIIITVNLAIGFITPPVAANLFVASGLTGIPIEILARKIWPFVLALFLSLIIITMIPEVSLWLPNLLAK